MLFRNISVRKRIGATTAIFTLLTIFLCFHTSLTAFLSFIDRGQGLNHCICDVSHLLAAFSSVLSNDSTLSAAITAYDEEIVPRGGEEVKCSIENGFMLHDWQKVLESPVFKNGFKPMKGHDGGDQKQQVKEEVKEVSEHAKVQMKREETEALGIQQEVAAH